MSGQDRDTEARGFTTNNKTGEGRLGEERGERDKGQHGQLRGAFR